jgi:hypothetical protein
MGTEKTPLECLHAPPSGESLGEFHRFPEEPITPQRIPFQDSRKDAILVNVEDECSLIR